MKFGSRRFWTFSYRVAFALLALAVLVVQGIASRSTDKPDPRLQGSLVVAAGTLALIDNVRSAWLRFRAPNIARTQVRAHKCLVGAMASMAQSGDADMKSIGANVYVIKRQVSRRWLVVPWWGLGLVREIRYRLTDTPLASNVAWASGKGVVGTCWRDERPQYFHWAPVAKRWGGNKLPDQAKFQTLPEKTASNFTYKEFIGIVDKYAEILAVPIMSEHGDKMLGVVSFDYPLSASSPGKQVLAGDVIEELALGAAAVLRGDLDKR